MAAAAVQYTKPTYLKDDLPIDKKTGKLVPKAACNYFLKLLRQPGLRATEILPMTKEVYPHAHACIFKKFAKPEECVVKDGLLHLGDSVTLKLMHIAKIYFFAMDLKEMGRQKGTLTKDQSESTDFLGLVPGITIIKKSLPNTKERCHDFAFQDKDWLEEELVKLYDTPEHLKAFLKSKGYTCHTAPQVGDVVAYFFKGETTHFGKVAQLGDKLKDTLVFSKLGESHFVMHRIRLVLINYGNDVIFFRET